MLHNANFLNRYFTFSICLTRSLIRFSNFSRTLNKLKAEHECTVATAIVGNTVPLVSDPSNAIASYLESYSPAVVVDTENEDQSIPETLIVPLNSNSSRLTNKQESSQRSAACVASSANVSRSNSFSQSQRTTTLSTHPCTRSASTGPASLTFESRPTWSGSHPLSASQNAMSQSISMETSLPTILTIATSLKEACIYRRPSTSLPPSYGDTVLPSTTQDGVLLSPLFQSHCSFSADSDRPPMLVRYALSDSSPPIQSNGSCTEGLLASLVSVSSTDTHRSTSTDTVGSFELRGTLGDLYTIIRSDSSVTSGLEMAPAIASCGSSVCTLRPSDPIDSASLLASKVPVTLLVSSDPTRGSLELATVKQPSKGSGTVESQSVLDTSPQALPRFQASNAISLLHDTNSSTFLLNTDSQLQQLTALYPGLNGAVALTPNCSVSGSLNNGTAPFTLQSGADTSIDGFNFISTLPSASTTEVNMLGAQSIRVLQSAGLLQNGLAHFYGPQHEGISTFFPSSIENKGCTTGVPGQSVITSTSQLGLSSPASSMPCHISTSYPSVYQPPSSISIPINLKRNKRSASTFGRKCRVSNATVVMTNSGKCTSVMCADSSTDVNPYRAANVQPDEVQTGLKRPRNSAGTPLTVSTGLMLSDTYIDGTGTLVYMSEPHQSIAIKPEPLQADFLDSTSNHSEAFSTGTSRTVQGNTPSPIDGLDQSHLKLERKRARNRVAARRCRERKISLIRALETQVAERDAHVKSLEDMVALYRSEGERLRAHMEMLAGSYPSLKGELCQFPFLFQSRAVPDSEASQIVIPASSIQTELPSVSKHFS
ncbi:hypothetical protein P879_04840 [Paragonimus westermani]|uniref:BZIP domain-containing protein n=1 Tax=Paragonimus westermani TaxID=34504 RepID=A0A8T0D106_9TREM|nr:hypothetical protein P879_04840 [Paragonimus westermani]